MLCYDVKSGTSGCMVGEYRTSQMIGPVMAYVYRHGTFRFVLLGVCTCLPCIVLAPPIPRSPSPSSDTDLAIIRAQFDIRYRSHESSDKAYNRTHLVPRRATARTPGLVRSPASATHPSQTRQQKVLDRVAVILTRTSTKCGHLTPRGRDIVLDVK